ncbi:adenylate/guanylate cyclase domain-containing protein [Seohaeicola zhoushanensis]|nr:adenylate/guanylate cyclase domain-containing protein [Seohaeicola zhoushanensis]
MHVSEHDRSTPATSVTIAFIDLAGFSAITDIYGDEAALALLTTFEALVHDAIEGHAPPVKWMGDEVMLVFPDPMTALGALGRLLSACRQQPRLPLTRVAVHHGPVLQRAGDFFGSTVNIAARVASLAGPGQLLATEAIAKMAEEEGISMRALGPTAIRSLPAPLALYELYLAPAPDPAWIDPVCKMLAPFAPFGRDAPDQPWFCSAQCAAAFARSPWAYPLPSVARD